MSNRLDEIDLGRLWPLIPWAVLAAVIAIGLWTSYYTVQPEEEAVVKRFGKVIGIRGPRLHFRIPFGIDRAYPVPTKRVLKQEFGFRTVFSGGLLKRPSLGAGPVANGCTNDAYETCWGVQACSDRNAPDFCETARTVG